MSRTVLVQRVVTDAADDEGLPFDRFEQVVAVLEDVADDVTADQAVEMAYQEANMRTRRGTHLVRNVDGTARVEYESNSP
jgi:hypothetical protein